MRSEEVAVVFLGGFEESLPGGAHCAEGTHEGAVFAAQNDWRRMRGVGHENERSRQLVCTPPRNICCWFRGYKHTSLNEVHLPLACQPYNPEKVGALGNG